MRQNEYLWSNGLKESLGLGNLPLKRTRLSMEHDRMNSMHMPLLLS